MLILFLACVTGREAIAASTAELVVAARPGSGFNYAYVLRMPTQPSPRGVLLVETNNSGSPSDDAELHLRAALDLSRNGLGGRVADELGLPMLMPVFPRPLAHSEVYTHLLDRDTLTISAGPMRRLDLQLVAMIDDARRSLAEKGMTVDERVLLTGFSASGKFANRFTALHPGRVLAVATGGMNGLAILPVGELADRELMFPIGVADLTALAGASFDAAAWRRVPQFLFMGAHDTNDAVEFEDAYSAAERSLIHELLGKEMLPTRWDRCMKIYADFGANATFRTYASVGHGTTGEIRAEVARFFSSLIDSDRRA